MGQMTLFMTGIALGSLPSNTEINPKERAKMIAIKSEGQLPEIHVKRPISNKETLPSLDKDRMK